MNMAGGKGVGLGGPEGDGENREGGESNEVDELRSHYARKSGAQIKERRA